MPPSQVRRVTLDEALALFERNNLDLRMTREEVAAAQARAGAAGRELPRIGPATDNDIGSVFGLDAGGAIFALLYLWYQGSFDGHSFGVAP